MPNLEQRYREYLDHYIKENGHTPDEAVVKCGEAIVRTGNTFYHMGVSDAKNNMPLPQSVFDDSFARYPDVPADFREAVVDLMKQAYESGWKEGMKT